MEKEQYNASQVSKYQKLKWTVEDMTGLYIHKIIAMASRDPEVKEMYENMREALIEEGDQPKALRISQEIKSQVMINTRELVN